MLKLSCLLEQAKVTVCFLSEFNIPAEPEYRKYQHNFDMPGGILLSICSTKTSDVTFNPFKPSVLFMEHKQIV